MHRQRRCPTDRRSDWKNDSRPMGEREMREDHLIKMDEMFPDGYIVVYTQKSGDIRMSLYNPHQDKTIEKFHRLLKASREID